MNRIVGWIVVVVLVGVGAYFVFPGFRSKVDATYDKHFGWTPEARRKDPVGFIEYSIGKLGDNVTKFESARGDLRVAQTNLEGMKRTNEEKVAFAEKQLQEFKGAYQAAKGGKGWPAAVAGRSYSEAELKSQVTLLLSQKSGYEKVLKQVEGGIATADKRSLQLVNRINESKMKLGLLEAQKALVSVNKLTADTEKLMADVNEVIVENEAMAEKSAVRTVEELMRESEDAAASVTNPGTEAFLNS
jgi:hypothetical protein